MALQKVDLTTPQPGGKVGEPTKEAWRKFNENVDETAALVEAAGAGGDAAAAQVAALEEALGDAAYAPAASFATASQGAKAESAVQPGEFQAATGALQQQVDTLVAGQQTSAIYVDTLNDLQAVIGTYEGQGAVVANGPDAGQYRWDGSAWEFLRADMLTQKADRAELDARVGESALRASTMVPLARIGNAVPLWMEDGLLGGIGVTAALGSAILAPAAGVFGYGRRSGKHVPLVVANGHVPLWLSDGKLGAAGFAPETLEMLASAMNTSDVPPVNIAVIYGQSNAAGSLSYSQTWRTPWPVFGEYPPGYTGAPDGPTEITTAQMGNNRTIAAGRDGFVPLAGGKVFGCTSEGIGHGLADSVAKVYPDQQFVVFGHGVGGAPLEYLDKPTPAEIAAGLATGVPIPSTSAEYLMLAAGQSMRSILSYDFPTCATPYFKGMWLIAKTAALLASEGRKGLVTLSWLQGEANSTDVDYAAKLAAFYDQYKADVLLLTSQRDMVMLMQEPQYSAMLEQEGQAGFEAWKGSGYGAAFEPGGANSAYTAEAARSNTYHALNLRQGIAAVEAPLGTPARSIYNVGPCYPLTSLIHRHPHAARNEGENFGKAFRKVVVEGKGWSPLQPISFWYDASSIYVRFHVPKGRLQFVAPPNAAPAKAGMPYGLEHSAGALLAAKVVRMGADVLRITPEAAPAAGQTLRYVASARTGDICDEDATAPIFTDRDGAPNVLRNYCIPFTLTL